MFIAPLPSGTQKCAVKFRENRSFAGVCKSVYRCDDGRYTYLHKKISFLAPTGQFFIIMPHLVNKSEQ